jgi:rhodanese-related sulfurtransferase
MPAPDTIIISQLSRLIGLPDAPVLLDVRTDEDYAADPRLLPAAFRRDYRSVTSWAADYAGRSVVVVCQRGLKLS